MIRLPDALAAWRTDAFPEVLKREIRQLPGGVLPLAAGLDQAGHIDDSDIEVTVLSATADAASVRVGVGVFFTEIVANCGCGDEPLPRPAYCRLEVLIDRETGAAGFAPVTDQGH